jgi:hypothetical protein
MKKDEIPDLFTPNDLTGKQENVPSQTPGMNRRKFVELTASAAVAFTIVPRHVLGGRNYVAPSDKVTLAYIGTGTQGLREMLPLLAIPEIQVVAVCDPNKEAIGYRDWGTDYLRDEIRKAIKNPKWHAGGGNIIPGGRENGKSVVDAFYATVRPDQKFKGCTAYADFR